MQVIGVIDLAGGRAVHARGGRRDEYQPVRSVAGVRVEDGDAKAVARIYVERLGITELYAADLDAIAAGAPQEQVAAQIAGCAPVWLDAGVSSIAAARRALASGATRVIVGLETLRSFDTLAAICDAVDGPRVAFSLDLRNGAPIAGADLAPAGMAPHVVAARAAACGVGAVIVLDLARVGAAGGPDLETIARVREAVPHVRLVGGGGVRGAADLRALAGIGCEGALVATALHDGRLAAEDVAAAQKGYSNRSR